MIAAWLLQPPIPGEQTLHALSEEGVGVILALAFLLLMVGVILGLRLWDGWQRRQADNTAKAAAASEADNKADTTQILELAKAIGTLATTNSARDAALDRQTAALEKLAASVSEQSTLFRQFIETYAAQTNEHERISRQVAAEAVDTVMAKLTAIESRLRGPVMTKQLDDLIRDMAAIKVMLKEPLAPVVSANETPPSGLSDAGATAL